MYKGKIFRKKEGSMIVFNRPEKTIFVPVRGELRANLQDGDQVEFEIEGSKVGTARVTKYVTQRTEEGDSESVIREHLERVRQEKIEHLRSQNYTKAATCREIEKALQAMYKESNTWNPSDGPESAEEL